MTKRLSKEQRQASLIAVLEEAPLQTDEELARRFNVSVQTIRMDRLELGLPEMRERARDLAERVQYVRSMLIDDVVGELQQLQLGRYARSVLRTEASMGFSRNEIIRGHHIFAQANSLAVAVIDAEAALTGTARLRYVRPVQVGETIVAEARVVRQKQGKALVRVTSTVASETVFTGDFIVVARGEAKATRGETR